jgi:hypothetical protein
VINETLARTLWPGEDPIGKRIGSRGPNPNWREIVGVVGDITFPAFGASGSVDTQFQTYWPLAQSGTAFVNILLRTDRTPDGAASALRSVAAAIDRDLPVYGVTTAEAAQLAWCSRLSASSAWCRTRPPSARVSSGCAWRSALARPWCCGSSSGKASG